MRLMLVAGAILLFGSRPAGAQDHRTDATAAALNAVIDWRVNWMGDSTRFDACRLSRALHHPSDFPRQILEPLRRALDPFTGPCAGRAEGLGTGRPTRVVLLDSLSVSDTLATVHVHVRKGEKSYSETYTLQSARGGGWGVRSVLVWGGLRIVPPPPRPSGGGAAAPP